MTNDSPATPEPMALPANNRLALRQVCRTARKGALATFLKDSKEPYASLVTVAFDHDLSPILLLSQLSDHTKNLMTDPRCSLLLDQAENLANPQTGPRVSLQGVAEQVKDQRLMDRYLARFPRASQYAHFGDFGLWRINLTRAHFVGGFGRAVWFDTPFGINPSLGAALKENEERLRADLNACHSEKFAAATKMPGNWHIALMDEDGIDLVQGDISFRLNFAEAADSLDSLKDRVAGLF